MTACTKGRVVTDLGFLRTFYCASPSVTSFTDRTNYFAFRLFDRLVLTTRGTARNVTTLLQMGR